MTNRNYDEGHSHRDCRDCLVRRNGKGLKGEGDNGKEVFICCVLPVCQ
jgi:hypothetical protein